MLVLISGPSGAGKSSFLRELLTRDERLTFSVSVTTRPPRAGEVDGTDYRFVTDTEFDRLVAADAFVEWATVHDNRYGTLKEELDRTVNAGQIPVLDVDVQGGVQVIDLFGDELVSVFLFPPSWAELERRLRHRSSDAESAIGRRLANARWEVGFADRYRYWIVNDDLDEAVASMRAIVVAERCRRERYATLPLPPPGSPPDPGDNQ